MSGSLYGSDCLQCVAGFALSDGELILVLKIHPARGIGPEELRQAQGRIGTDTAATTRDLVGACWNNSDGFG